MPRVNWRSLRRRTRLQYLENALLRRHLQPLQPFRLRPLKPRPPSSRPPSMLISRWWHRPAWFRTSNRIPRRTLHLHLLRPPIPFPPRPLLPIGRPHKGWPPMHRPGFQWPPTTLRPGSPELNFNTQIVCPFQIHSWLIMRLPSAYHRHRTGPCSIPIRLPLMRTISLSQTRSPLRRRMTLKKGIIKCTDKINSSPVRNISVSIFIV